jgi:isopentenyl phosphate kinase
MGVRVVSTQRKNPLSSVLLNGPGSFGHKIAKPLRHVRRTSVETPKRVSTKLLGIYEGVKGLCMALVDYENDTGVPVVASMELLAQSACPQ